MVQHEPSMVRAHYGANAAQNGSRQAQYGPNEADRGKLRPHVLQTSSAKYGPNFVENWIELAYAPCPPPHKQGQNYINSLRCSSAFHHQELGLQTLHTPQELESRQA